jgi:hypothetical protein
MKVDRHDPCSSQRHECDVIGVLAERFTDLADRTRGPMKFRLVLQPLMAALFAVRAALAMHATDRRHISGRS